MALDERVDIPVELQNPLDLRYVNAGDAIKLKTTHEVVVGGHTVIPKGAIITGKISSFQRNGESVNMALLAERATWKGQTFDLRAYIWGPIKSIGLASDYATNIKPELGDPALIGRMHPDATLGTVLDFFFLEVVSPSCHMDPLRCEKVAIESGSSFVVRHLPPEYKLDLLFNDAAYGRARAL